MLRIVLVEPREAGNVGAAARVMKNFGFTSMAIVGEHPELLPVSGWWASGADDVLQRATFHPTLLDAISDAVITVATTSQRGRPGVPGQTPAMIAERLASLGESQTLALVFGREDSGLTHEEIALCQYTAAIPTHPDFPTMNLAQAVGVFCFALSAVGRSAETRALAEAGLVERMHQRIRALLLEIGFLHANNPDRIYDDVRSMIARADLDEREVTLLLGIVRQAEWALRSRGAGPEERP